MNDLRNDDPNFDVMGNFDHGLTLALSKGRRASALRKMQQLKKKGIDICPIEIETRKITQTVWGNAWCDHIESFSDYENRLPRGRTYVRNGSVCHLAISEGCVQAMVSGSSLYKVRVDISCLDTKKWQMIRESCTGKIGSLLDLLNGQLSDDVMQVVCHRNKGLFPLNKEIKLSCSCPDWAVMCKHVAAVLYGVGARLDHSPEKLFELRGVDHHELIDLSAVDIDITQARQSDQRRIDHAAISDIFDIDIAKTTTTRSIKKKIASKQPHKTKRTRPDNIKHGKPVTPVPKYFSGAGIQKKREQLRMSKSEFANQVGVSATTIANWERKGRYKLKLRDQVEDALKALWAQ